MNTQRWLKVGLGLAAAVLTVLVVEGGYSLYRAGSPRPSLFTQGWEWVRGIEGRSLAVYQPDLENVPGVAGAPPAGTPFSIIESEDEVRPLLPALRDSGVFLGNSPFAQLVTEEAQSGFDDPETGIEYLKPNLSGRSGYLRSYLYNVWDPIAFHASNRVRITPPVEEFLARYQSVSKQWTTDGDGHRTTVPASRSEEIVLVVGDSVAFGAMLEDRETIASRLQQRQDDVRFINAGVPGASFDENLVRLEELLETHVGHVRGVVYVHCENDTRSRIEAGKAFTPDEVVSQIADLLDAHDITYRVFVYHQYMQQTMPEILRDRSEEAYQYYEQFRARTLDLLPARGFHLVDFQGIVRGFQAASGTPFAGIALYVDQCHFSPLGTRVVVERIPRVGEML